MRLRLPFRGCRARGKFEPSSYTWLSFFVGGSSATVELAAGTNGGRMPYPPTAHV